MISTNRVWTAVQSIINKDERSAITPTEYNAYSSLAMADIIDEARKTTQGVKALLSIGREDLQRQKYAQEVLNYFYKPATLSISANMYDKPTDLEQVDKLYYTFTVGEDDEVQSVEIERLRTYKDLELLRRMGKHLSPDGSSAKMSLYYLDTEATFMVYPEEFAQDIQLYYHRAPKVPKWTYTVINNTPVYDGTPVDRQDFELTERNFDNLVLKICMYAGVTLRDTTLIQSMNSIDKKEETEEQY